METLKRCPKCKIHKDIGSFAFNKGRRGGGRSSTCKQCLIANSERWRRDPRKKLNTDLKYNYDITLDEYEEILRKQGGKCAICDKEPVQKSRGRLFVDHCHKTGKVRGLLCHHCNDGLGKFMDRPELLLRAVKYLDEQTT